MPFPLESKSFMFFYHKDSHCNGRHVHLVSVEIRNVLKLINPSRPDPERREKINLNFYFHTSLW